MRSRASSPLMPPLSEIAAIILAAGLSSRFEAGPEETKLVVPLCGKPLVRHAAEAALASRARPILVVTGHATSQVEAALKNRVQSGLPDRPREFSEGGDRGFA
jgi:CTP:molybdopterin cytidylyltransferase MocA